MDAPDPASRPTLTRAQRDAASKAKWRVRHETALDLAAPHDGVVTRQMLLQAGMTRGQIRAAEARGLWCAAGRHTLCISNDQPIGRGLLWQALWEAGPSATLDGAAALSVAGLTGWRAGVIDVTVPYNSRVRPMAGVRHHFLRDRGEVIDSGLRRTKPQVAVVRAAQWASTDKQAATLVAMVVQQRLVKPETLLEHWNQIEYARRRTLLDRVIADVCDGAHSLAELDFARLCRERGLPEPTRQAVRTAANGRVYLDVSWDDLGVHVEIQGAQHNQGTAGIDDALRVNALNIDNRRLVSLQIPVLGLRVCPDTFLDQVEQAINDARAAA